jgi:hypothetical protein
VARADDDPPDFWVTIDGEEFAVEVASIVKGQEYHATCRKLAEAIGKASKERGVLKGTYALAVMRHPTLPKRTSPKWRGLVSQANSFIGANRGAESTREARLLEDADGHLGITKLSSQGATVELLGPTDGKWEDKIQDEIHELMQEAVANKRRKLEKKGVPSQCPRIMLLLYDAYGYGDTDDAQRALLRVHGYEWFHSVFWACSFTDRPNELSPEDPGRRGTFLYSKRETWWRSPTTRSA